MRNLIVGASAALLLAGCATPAVKSVCLPMKEYSKEDQALIAETVAALPIGSMVGQIITDYGAMRDDNRACQGRRSR